LGYVAGWTLLLVLAAAVMSLQPHPEHRPIVVVPFVAIFLFLGELLTAWRCHDFNEGYWSHLWRSQSLFFGRRLAATGDLLFMPGDEGDNDYGSAPWI